MTARLPTPGADNGTWGTILNDFLEVSLTPDGTLNPNTVGQDQLQTASVGTTQLQAGAVTTTTIANNAVTSTQLASAIQTNLSLASSSVQSVNSQTPSGSGAVTLTASELGALSTTNNLSDVSSTSSALANLGGAKALIDSGSSITTSGTILHQASERVDATSGAITRTAPAIVTGPPWDNTFLVKKIDTSSNVITISYPNTAGTTSTETLIGTNQAKAFRQTSGLGYEVEVDSNPLEFLETQMVPVTQTQTQNTQAPWTFTPNQSANPASFSFLITTETYGAAQGNPNVTENPWSWGYNVNQAVVGEIGAWFKIHPNAGDTKALEMVYYVQYPDSFPIQALETLTPRDDTHSFSWTFRIGQGASDSFAVTDSQSPPNTYIAMGPARDGLQLYMPSFRMTPATAASFSITPTTGTVELSLATVTAGASTSIVLNPNGGSGYIYWQSDNVTQYRLNTTGSSPAQLQLGDSINNVNIFTYFPSATVSQRYLSLGCGLATPTGVQMGFFGAALTVQPTAAAETSGYTAGTSTAVTIDGTTTGGTGTTAYTMGDVVVALKKLGLVKS